MIYFIKNSKYYICIIVLSFILVLLLVLKRLLTKKIGKISMKVEKGSTIGNEEIQEDCLDIVYSQKEILAVLADGLGKDEAGKISSIVAVKTFTSLFLKQENIHSKEYFFKRAFNVANNEILKRIDDSHGGASVASVVITDNTLYYGLVGDIIISIFRKGELFKLSEGHTLNVLAKKGFYKGKITREDALLALKEKKLLHYVGREDFNDIEILKRPIKLQKEDIVVLMNKGIYHSLTWNELEQIIIKNRKFKNLANEIIQTVKNNKNHNKYNGSIILMKYIND